MRDFNADVEDEIERVGSMLERQMERDAARYEQRIRDLEAAVLEAQGSAFYEGLALADEQIAAAEARGYDAAVARLRRSPRQLDRAAAEYLEALKETTPDV